MKKRILSMVLALAMCLTMVPNSAFALETPEDTDSGNPAVCNCETKCTEGEENADCSLCSTEGADLTLCIGAEPDQEPTEQSPAADEAVASVQAQLDALPTADEVSTMDAQAQNEVYTALQTAYDAYDALTAEQQALVTGADAFESLFNWFNSQISTLEDGSATMLNTSVASVVIGSTTSYYDTFDAAWTALKSGTSTITLLKDCTYSSGL